MKQKKSIENVSLTFECPQNWDAMAVCGNGRFCTVCQKIVYDFTDKSQKDYEIALRQHGGQMCGRFTSTQMAPSVNFAQVAALAALSITAAYGNAQTLDTIAPPPQAIMGEIALPRMQKDKNDNVFCLFAEQQPEFLGGQAAMHQFIKDSLKYPMVSQENEIQGTVYVSFIVETDGQLTNINVKRGISGGCNEEAVRLVNLMSGQWKAGKQMGKPVRVAYTIPIKFKLE